MTVRTQPAQRTQAVQSSQPRVDLGSAILASLKAIKDNPTGRTVGEQATALAGVFREAGVKTNNWEHYLLLNFKKTVTGEDPNALSYMKTNLSWAGEVMSRGDINRAISMATQANRAVANKSGIDVKTAQDWMGKQLSSDRPMTEKLSTSVASTLRDAGFSDDAKKTGLALVRMRRQIVEPLRYGTRGLEALQKDVGDLKALTVKAGKQGVINRGTQSELLRLVDLYQKDSRFQVKTPDQVAQVNRQAEVRRVDGVNSKEMAPYRELLGDLKYLRDTLGARNGSMWGSGPAVKNSADILISRIPAFEKAIASGRVDDVKRFVENNLGDRPNNQSVRQWADSITATDARHQKIFAAGHAIIEQFGPVAYVASKILSNVMKGQRDNLPLKSVAYNTLVDIVSYAAGKGYAGKVGGMVKETMLDFARTAAADIAKDPSPAGIGKALVNAWKGAVLGLGGKALKELSADERKDMAKLLYDIGTKVFDETTVRPIIADAFKER